MRSRTTATGYNTPTAHFRNRRCLAKCRRRLGRAFALKPAEEASSSRSQSAAAVSDIDAPSRTVRPPFRLFDPFSARLLRFQPDGSSKAPVRTSVATEFNPGEQQYHTINLLFQSIGNSGGGSPIFSRLSRPCGGLRGFESVLGKERRLSSSIFGIIPKC